MMHAASRGTNLYDEPRAWQAALHGVATIIEMLCWMPEQTW